VTACFSGIYIIVTFLVKKYQKLIKNPGLKTPFGKVKFEQVLEFMLQVQVFGFVPRIKDKKNKSKKSQAGLNSGF
jgi:hypothetical protein